MGALRSLPARLRAPIDELITAGRLHEAIDRLDRLDAEFADYPDALALRARLRLDCREPQLALVASRKLIRSQSESAIAWDLHGRILNNLRQPLRALEAFDKARTLSPDFAEAWFHAGHVLRGLGRLKEARDALKHAVALDDSLVSAWQGLAGVAQGLGDNALAIDALDRAAAIAHDDAAVHRDLALVLHAAGELDRARSAFEAAVALNPADPLTRQGFGVLCHELRDSELAEAELKKAVELAPQDPSASAQLAHLYDELNRTDEARQIVASARLRHPDDPLLRLEAARQLRRAGDIVAAVDVLEPVSTRSISARVARQVHHELGRLYDRAGRYEDAWRHFMHCNDLARTSERAAGVSAERFVGRVQALHAFFSSHGTTLAATDLRDDALPAPAFLIGFPRSGTTLTDVMLDSHPGITSLEERPTVNAVEAQIRRRPGGYPNAMLDLARTDVDALRAVYFSAVSEYARIGADQLLLDKQPMRTIHTGLIWRMFPDARLILALRHPCDVILSNVMQDYALNDMTANFFDLHSAAALYDAVMRLWQRYTETLPLHFETIRYEDLVDDRRGQLERLLAFLGLPWHPAMDDYLAHVSRRGRIDTTSFDQVSEPVYRRSRLRWHNYRKYLEPALPRLDEHIRRFGYDD